MLDDLVRLYLMRQRTPPTSGDYPGIIYFRPNVRGGESPEEGHMHNSPSEYDKPKATVEPKVKAGTAGAYLGLLAVLAPLQAIQADLDLIAFLPDWLETLAIPLVPGLVTYVAGYVAKHAPRPDLPQSQR